MHRAVILLSGGLDSATTLYIAKREGFKCYCLIFDYGQRHIKEIKAAKHIARAVNCSFKILKINLPWRGSSLLDRKISIPVSKRVEKYKSSRVIPTTYVPARNIIFLSFALSYAEAIGASHIYIGAHAQDYSGYPDCRPEFLRTFEEMISKGTKAGVQKRGIKIHSPLINKTKAQIIKLGLKLGVPFELTWSCYKGGRHPCGECDSCYFRAKGFRAAGLSDPLAR